MKDILRSIKSQIELEVLKIRLRRHYPKCSDNTDRELHIREAARWLCRAQDFGSDRGVSYGSEFGLGFMPSYPETTGYIIETFIRLSEYFDDEQFLRRAIEMGDWEIQIQMDSGAVMGGMIGEPPTPAIFNTGQVIFGWNSLYAKTGEQRFALASQRAVDWLVDAQEENGNWIRFNSIFARAGTTVYNVRAAWAVGQLGRLIGRDDYVEAAVKNACFAVRHQLGNGWFQNCCLTDPDKPLLHTTAYTMRGLLEIGALSDRQEFIDASARTARSVLGLMDDEGYIPGRIDAAFNSAATYACMTGSAQSSIVWSRLYQLTGDTAFRDAVPKVNAYLIKRHDISSADPSIRGGITGSWPVHGEYGRFKMLNWATKFFIDALLLQKESEKLP